MKALLVFAACIGLSLPAPLESEPSRDVELVEPINTNERDPDRAFGGGPVIILRRNPFAFPDFSSIFGGFGHGHSVEETSEAGGRDRIGNAFPFPDLSSIFGDNGGGRGNDDGETETVDNDRRCGFLCTVFRNIRRQMEVVEDEIRVLQGEAANRENEVDEVAKDEGPKVTYSEKVLPDGSILKINRTQYSGEDGNSFFSVHSTRVVTHNAGDGDDTNVEEETAETEERTEENVDRSSLRRKRHLRDAFDQQVEDTSFLLKGFEQKPEQLQEQLRQRPIRYNFEGDTRVNDLLLENALRGALIRLEPDAELLSQTNQDDAGRE